MQGSVTKVTQESSLLLTTRDDILWPCIPQKWMHPGNVFQSWGRTSVSCTHCGWVKVQSVVAEKPSAGVLPTPIVLPGEFQDRGAWWTTAHGVAKSWTQLSHQHLFWASHVALVVKNPPANAGDLRDVGCITGSGRSPGGGHGNPLQSCCLENPMDRGAWRATVHGVAKSQMRLNRLISTVTVRQTPSIDAKTNGSEFEK